LIARFDATCNGRKCFRRNGRPRYEARVWNHQPPPAPPGLPTLPAPAKLLARPAVAAPCRRLSDRAPAPPYRLVPARWTRLAVAIGCWAS
jgi:hypothetical protein